MKKNIPRYTLEEMKSVADKISPFITDINFGTGEFLVNPNAKKLLEYIKGRYPHVNLAITSNGYSIISMTDDELKKYFHDIDISIDFPDKDRHNAFRRHPRAWEWVIGALEKTSRLGIDTSITSCVHAGTRKKDLGGLLSLSKKYSAFLRINWFRQTGRGKSELRLTPRKAWEVIKYLSERSVFYTIDSVFAGPLGIKNAQSCPACRGSMRVHQDMSVTPAPYLKGNNWSAGNILHDDLSLEDIQESQLFRRVLGRQVDFCRDCPHYGLCRSGCVTRASLHNGSLDQPDDFCPVLGGIALDFLKNIRVKMAEDCDLVHSGYLCTTIVKSS